MRRKINKLLKSLDGLEIKVDKLLEPLYEQLDEIISVYEDRYMNRSDSWQESKKGQDLWDKIEDLRLLHKELDCILEGVSSSTTEIHYVLDQVSD